MIEYKKYTLDNGLRLVLHKDVSTPMVAVNIVYDVGSKDENPERTGFAHLFEHLMFGGSKNVPDFDVPIQMAGGENNAFTNNDVTNFYNVLPAQNLETALWLESDRMKHLNFSQEALDTQKKVVVEEFKETCLNEPYGDMWHYMLDMAYKNHGYRWPVIGIKPEHIEEATYDDVKNFFYKHYRPQNAVLVIAGNIEEEKTLDLVNKWFGDIEKGEPYIRSLTPEGKSEYRAMEVYTNVPVPALYMSFHMVDRLHPDYYACDLISDVFSNGRSSRFFQKLHKEQRLFSQIDAFITGTFDPGLLVIEGRPMGDKSIQEGKDAIWKELELLKKESVTPQELQKLVNKVETSLIYAEVNILHKAMSLAYYEVLGKIEQINLESKSYQKVTPDDIQRVANEIFQKENCSKLIYYPKEESPF